MVEKFDGLTGPVKTGFGAINKMAEEAKRAKPESVEGQKLEWGQELRLGYKSWEGAQEKIAELNAKLAQGEKLWRLPTKEELVAEFKKNHSTPAGFQENYYVASIDEEDPHYPDVTWRVSMRDGHVDYYGKDDQEANVRLVRDVA